MINMNSSIALRALIRAANSRAACWAAMTAGRHVWHYPGLLLTIMILLAGCLCQSMREDPPSPSQLKIKAITPIVTCATLAVLLLYDWGEGNVFSGIRPAVKSVFNSLLNPKPKPNTRDAASEPGRPGLQQ